MCPPTRPNPPNHPPPRPPSPQAAKLLAASILKVEQSSVELEGLVAEGAAGRDGELEDLLEQQGLGHEQPVGHCSLGWLTDCVGL